MRAIRCLLLLPILAGAGAAPAVAAPSPWQAVAGKLPARSSAGAPVETRPERFAAFALRRAALIAALADAPLEHSGGAPVTVALPAPGGALQRFAAVESPVMEPGLAARHPSYKSYSAVGIDDPSATARFDINSLGFHASVRSARGAWYVDPYYRGDDTAHVSYFGRNLGNVHGPLAETVVPGAGDTARAQEKGRRRAPGDIVQQRVYRLALISDPEYATYHGAANVTAAKMTLIDRVNQLYNDDLAIKLVLIAGNEDLNLDTEAEYSGALGPCVAPCYPPPTGEACDLQTIAQNNFVAGAIVGPTSYDIGHLILGKPGGGVALLGVVGDPAQKASGCTGVETPVGDLFAIDYVAHEMGHQFSGNHTFNGNQHSCSGGNRNADTSVETGSGSSIQAYAGICRQDNLQPHSDPYFSQRSIEEIQAFVTSSAASGGNEVIATTNHSPVVSAPLPKTIPIRTPFTLTGSATDADAGQTLIHLWEQNDADDGDSDGKALTDNAKDSGPLFRVFGTYADVSETATLQSPSPGENLATAADLERTFPDLRQIAAGNTNAATGTCPTVMLAPPSPEPAPPPIAVPVVDCYSEFLPTSARELHFRLTSRDRFATGGGVSAADTTITVAGTQPFRVTSQPTATGAARGASLPVTWDVAGTTAAPFSVAEVKISYSTDGGLTFPTVLAATTPNDGAEIVTVPATDTTAGRFKVEAVGNYFFDVSRGDLTVTEGGPGGPTGPTGPSGPSGPTGPVVTATPPPVTPATPGFLRPVVSGTPKRPRVSTKRKVTVFVRCVAVGTYALPARCRGKVRLAAKLGKRARRIGRKKFTADIGAIKLVTVKIRKRAYRKLKRSGRLKATVRATVGTRSATKKVTLRR